MNIRKIAITTALIGAVGLTAACGGSSDDDIALPPLDSTTASSAAPSADAETGTDAELTNKNKRPSVEALNGMLSQALDPDIKPKDKTELVEGSEVDPDLFNQLVKAAEDNPDVEYEIKKPVTGAGPGKANVKVEVRLPDNPPTKIDASIVYDDGRWKLSKSTVCPLLTANDVETPLCADSGAKKSKAPAGADN